ncbi:piggyBac transposable element-derived protein 2-like [Bactrocera neohumeralis]|uniref:piggyBac transposable element-derived protein 2-like n=1 Tax=Bactrocera tryoni TaxID=59916 RepID=UPI001A97758F|nr:piggyBac transposable element-derived protein 2-like [Bactrocera tryoni]XP_050337903.1 piggyBac transposable element-derived protein 2-like [Bactrocera neohumeralis]
MFSQRALKLHEIEGIFEEILEDVELGDESTIDIVQLPPDADSLTDCEDVDEDNLDEVVELKAVTGEVEIHFTEREQDIAFSPSTTSKRQKLDEENAASKTRSSRWTHTDATYSQNFSSSERWENSKASIREKFQQKEPLEIFEFFFDDLLVQHVVKESVRYAHQNNFHGFSLSSEYFRKFLGILIFTSYHSLPSEKMYWCTDDDVDIQIVRNSMPKNRYLEIKRFLHLANNDNISNSLPEKDFKIMPLIENLNENVL